MSVSSCKNHKSSIPVSQTRKEVTFTFLWHWFNVMCLLGVSKGEKHRHKIGRAKANNSNCILLKEAVTVFFQIGNSYYCVKANSSNCSFLSKQLLLFVFVLRCLANISNQAYWYFVFVLQYKPCYVFIIRVIVFKCSYHSLLFQAESRHSARPFDYSHLDTCYRQ